MQPTSKKLEQIYPADLTVEVKRQSSLQQFSRLPRVRNLVTASGLQSDCERRGVCQPRPVNKRRMDAGDCETAFAKSHAGGRRCRCRLRTKWYGLEPVVRPSSRARAIRNLRQIVSLLIWGQAVWQCESSGRNPARTAKQGPICPPGGLCWFAGIENPSRC